MSLPYISIPLTKFIAAYESLHDGDLSEVGLQPKLDAREIPIWTKGFGHAIVVNGKFATIKEFPTLADILTVSPTISKEEAYELLLNDIANVAEGVKKRIKVALYKHQFDSLVSHAYNCGFSSTMYALINSKAHESEIKEWFTKHYITAGGSPLKGLILRRADEYQLWSEGDYNRDYNFNI